MSTFRFIVSSQALLAAAKLVGPLVANNPVVPILENLLLTVADGQLTVRASNLNTTFTTAPIAVEAAGQGSICVPAKLLTNTLGALPGQPLTITVDGQTYGVQLKAARSNYRLAGENPTDFPRPGASTFLADREAPRLTLPAAVWAEGLAAVLPFLSTDTNRMAITGALLKLEADGVRLVSTDGFRVAMFRHTAPGVPVAALGTPYVLPPDAIRLLLGLLKEAKPADAPVALALAPDYLTAVLPAGELHCRLIDERYPEWDQVIPVSNAHHLRADRNEWLAALRRAGLYANEKSNSVRMGLGKAGGEEVSLHAENLDFSNEGHEALSAYYEGDAVDLSFNAKYLADILQVLPAGDVAMTTNADPNRAVLLRAADEPDTFDARVRVLLMPIMPLVAA